MINLSQYQQIFDIDNTAERCKKVNDSMEQLWKSKLDQLAAQLLGQDYRIATYGQTLVTTYHDALNPKYAEQKKDSSIGRKYFAQIVRKVGNKEVNLLTLEFNGIEKRLYVTIDLSFYQVHELIKSDRLNAMLDELGPKIGTFTRTGSFTRNEIERTVLGQALIEMIKPRIRPWIYIGMMLPLEGEFEVSSIIDYLKQTWEQTAAFRQYSLEYSEQSAKAAHIMDLLASVEEPFTATLFGRSYQIQYGVTGNEKSGEREQEFSLKRDGQTIVQGCLLYREYEVRTGSSRPMLAVDVEGHNHTYTNVEALLGEGLKEWRLFKSFRTTNQDNEELKQEAMELLIQHDFEVEHNGYRIGTYNNSARRFEEDVREIKGKLVCAALLFAHVAGRGKFKFFETDATNDASIVNGDHIDDYSKEIIEYNCTFNFPVIYEATQNSSLTFVKDLIRDLHLNLTALDDKHFVILSGISGTGKTQLAKLYANAVYGLPYEADNPYLSIIPVRPDWTDGTALFGYYSSFENRYIMTEFLRIILHAHEEREKPHFIVLDEMNLARVEYYLSDYLSGVESHKEVPLHNRNDLDGIPSKINIPPNVYLIGTINVDETTHSISDKVLDRAFVMTLSDVDLETFWSRMDEGIRTGLQSEFTYLKRLHGLLSPYHLHFGYRTMSEMMKKLSSHLVLDAEYQTSRTAMLDQVISEKVLPKLKGDDRIAELLKDLKDLFAEHLGQESISCSHIIRMEKELLRYGATQF
ncbi:McrB family protein [Paenibacillus sp. J22TS3]|uniref:McrB family protein n=1 Tax=Paenibacillus sp. J22TS3 TaxID=2807192 RepID=UPI001B16080B|nr:AAA family ATPase [Paenibacillus sp. J22TS3]GIP20665.1 hypothetical protein J22TS3_09400 [Paenibacillus sp. J22TS3]